MTFSFGAGVRNYYDMIAARQELDLRPQLERLDRLICWSEDIDEGALTFAFRPLWQLDEPAKAALALTKAQATQVYAGLKLWPDAVMARLAEAQLVADGTYPNAAAVFAEGGTAAASASPTLDYDPAQPRDLWGRWTNGRTGAPTPAGAAGMPTHTQGHAAQQAGGLSWLLNMLNPIGTAQAAEEPPERLLPREAEPAEPAELEPGEVMRIQRFDAARKALEEINPRSRAFQFLEKPGALPSEAEIAQLDSAVRDEYIKRTCEFLRPDGKPIGERGTSSQIRVLSGGISAAQQDYKYLGAGGVSVPFSSGSMVRLPYDAGTITLRPITSTPGSPAVDVNIPRVIRRRLHYFGDE